MAKVSIERIVRRFEQTYDRVSESPQEALNGYEELLAFYHAILSHSDADELLKQLAFGRCKQVYSLALKAKADTGWLSSLAMAFQRKAENESDVPKGAFTSSPATKPAAATNKSTPATKTSAPATTKQTKNETDKKSSQREPDKTKRDIESKKAVEAARKALESAQRTRQRIEQTDVPRAPTTPNPATRRLQASIVLGVVLLLAALALFAPNFGPLGFVVVEGNQAPIFSGSSNVIAVSGQTTIDLSALFYDPEGQPIAYIATSGPGLDVSITNDMLTIGLTSLVDPSAQRTLTVIASDGTSATRQELVIQTPSATTGTIATTEATVAPTAGRRPTTTTPTVPAPVVTEPAPTITETVTPTPTATRPAPAPVTTEPTPTVPAPEPTPAPAPEPTPVTTPTPDSTSTTAPEPTADTAPTTTTTVLAPTTTRLPGQLGTQAAPAITSINLTSTNRATNDTWQNLTLELSVSADAGKNVTNITTWYRNGTSAMIFNLPFEGGSTSSWTKQYTSVGDPFVYGATWLAGRRGGGVYHFDGSNDYINARGSILAPSGSISFWFNTSVSQSSKYLMGQAPAGNPRLTFYQDASNKLTFWIRNAAGTSVGATSLSAINDGKWHHAVGSWSPSTGVRLYIDDVLQQTSSYAYDDSAPIAFFIGAVNYDGTASFFWSGQIDDVFVWSRALSADEMTLLYQNRTTELANDELIAGDVWHACVTPNDGTQDGTTVCSNNVTVMSYLPAVNNISLSSTNPLTNQTNTNLTLSINSSGDNGKSIANITTWYRNGQSIMPLNMPLATKDSHINGYINFLPRGGGNAHVTHTATLAPSELSVSAWIRPNEDLSGAYFLPIVKKDANDVNSAGAGYNVGFYNGYIQAFYNTDTDSSWDCQPGAANQVLDAGKWYNVVFVKNASGAFIYLNGTRVASDTTAICQAAIDYRGYTSTFYVGYNYGSGIGQRVANAAFDEVNIYNRGISATEIAADYQRGLQGLPSNASTLGRLVYWPLDGSPVSGGGNPINLIPVNSFTFNNTKDYGGSNTYGASYGPQFFSTGGPNNAGYWKFDGSGDQIDLGNASELDVGAGDHTIMAWARWTETTGNGRSIVNIGGFYNKIALTTGFTGNLDKVSYLNGTSLTTTATWRYNAGSGYNNGAWHHIAATKRGTTVTIYVDGVSQSYLSGTAYINGNNTIGLGAHGDWSGDIADVRVYNRALSSQQINAIFRNASDVIVSQELTAGDVWSAAVTPNDGTQDGVTAWTNNVTITQFNATVYLNTTNPATNDTTRNLTLNLYNTSWNNNPVTNITSWYRNGQPIMHFNLPFEANGKEMFNVTDYSGRSNNGSVMGATFSSAAGYDGKGAYSFSGSNQYLDFGTSLNMGNNPSMTIVAWVKPTALKAYAGVVSKTIPARTATYTLMTVVMADGTIGAYTPASTWKYSTSAGITTNKWYQVAYALQGGQITFYVNGVQYGAPQALSVTDTVGHAWFVGSWYSVANTYDFNGFIDNVQVYNRTLSSQQIAALYQNRTDTIVRQEVAAGDVWHACVTPNDGVSDGNSVCSNNVTVLSSAPSVNSISLSSANSSSNITDNNLTLSLQTSSPLGNSVANLTSWHRNGQPVSLLYLPFENNSNAYTVATDYSGFGIDATAASLTYNNTGGFDGKGNYRFDGTTSYIQTPVRSELAVTNEFSIEMWISRYADLGDASGYERLLSKGGGTNFDYFLQIQPSHVLAVGYMTPAAAQPYLLGTATIPLTGWHHIVATFKRNVGFALYIDGQLDASGVNAGDITQPVRQSASPVINVGRIYSSGWLYGFRGAYDNVRIWNRSLSAEQVKALYQNRDDLIVSQEILGGDVWHACVTPNDGVSDGVTVCSNNVTVYDETDAPAISFTDPTPANNTYSTNASIKVNISVGNGDDLSWLKWTFNGTNTSLFDVNDTLLFYGFDNLSVLGENGGSFQDFSHGRNATLHINDWNVADQVNRTFNAQLGGGWSGYTMRNILFRSYLNENGTRVRLYLRGPPSGTERSNIAKVYMCQQITNSANCEPGTNTQVLFNGQSRVNVAVGGTNVSDWTNIYINASKSYIVSLYFDDASNDNVAYWFQGGSTQAVYAVGDYAASDSMSGTSTSNVIVLHYLEIDGNETHLAEGKWGTAANFDGLNDYAELQAGYTNAPSGTVAMWLKTPGDTLGYPFITSTDACVVGRDMVVVRGNRVAGTYFDGAAWHPVNGTINDNEWTHVIYSWGTGGQKIFINGVLTNSTPLTGSGATDTVAFLGGWGACVNTNNPIYFFNGSIDDFRWYNRTTSADEALHLYRSSLRRTGIYSWTLDYNASDVPDSSFLYGACASDDNGNEVCTGLRNMTVNAENDAPQVNTIRLNTTNQNTNDTLQNLTLQLVTSDTNFDNVTNITTWYRNGSSVMLLNMPFEGGSTSGGFVNGTTKDYSGWGNAASVVEAAWNATGGHDGRGAFQFDGVNDSIDLGYNASLRPNRLTVAAWVKTLDDDEIVVGHRGANPYGYDLYVTSGGNARATVDGATTGVVLVVGDDVINDGKWHFLANTYDGNFVRLYVDGMLDGTPAALTDAAIDYQATNSIMVGLRNAESLPFNGTIDDVTIWNRSLSAEQVRALYQNRTDLIVEQEADTGDVWHVCVTPNDGIVDGVQVCSNNVTVRPVPPVSEFMPPTVAANVVTHNLSAEFNVSVTNASDLAEFKWGWNNTNFTFYNDSLLLMYNFDNLTALGEGSNVYVYDASPYGLNSSCVNQGATCNRTQGTYGMGVDFDGTNDYIDLGTAPTLNIIGPRTVSFWVKPHSKATGHAFFERIGGVASGTYGYIYAATSDTYQYYTPAGGWDTFDQPVDYGVWQHIVYVYDGTTMNVYKNGIPGTAKTVGATVSRPAYKNYVSAAWAGSAGYVMGEMDELRVWNKSLASDEVRQVYLSNLRKYEPDKWNFYANESWSAGNGNTTYEYFACAKDAAGNENCTARRTLEAVGAQPPLVGSILLNTTNPALNDTNQNLTLQLRTSDANDDPVRNITSWYRNGTPVMLLNMPFENNGNAAKNATDYSGFGTKGTVINATWTASGSADGSGFYMFDNRSIIQLQNTSLFRFGAGSGIAIEAWIWPNQSVQWTAPRVILAKGTDNGVRTFMFNLYGNTNLSFYFQNSSTHLWCGYGTKITNQKWQHALFTMQFGDNASARMYLNGQPVTGAWCIGNGTEIPTERAADVTIGAENASAFTEHFTGGIDNVRFWNRSLSADEVALIYQNRTDVLANDELLSGDVWHACVTPNDGTADGATVCSNNVTISGNTPPVINSIALNTTDITKNDTSQNLSLLLSASDINGDSVRNITSWYRNGSSIMLLNMPFENTLNAVKNATDYSGFGTKGTVINATWTASGGFDGGGYYMFDNRSIIQLQNTSLFRFGPGSGIAIDAWVLPNFSTWWSSPRIIVAKGSDGGLRTFQFAVRESGNLSFVFYNGTSHGFCGRGAPISNGSWQHVAFTMTFGDNSSARLYRNGQELTGAWCYGNGTMIPTDIITDVSIGAENGSAYTEHWTGGIDNVRIWNRSLSADQVALLYANRTDIVANDELAFGDVWSACVTPNDGNSDGATACSNNVTVLGIPNAAPVLQSVLLNSTDLATNNTFQNLTLFANATDSNGDPITIAGSWFRNGIEQAYQSNGTFGDIGDDYGYGVAVNANRERYVVGSFDSSFGSAQPVVLLVKYDENDSVLWNATAGMGGETGKAVALSPTGDVYVAAETSNYGAGSTDAWLLKYDASGNQLWNRTVGGVDPDSGKGVAVDSEGNAYIVGYRTDTFVYSWIVKFDQSGNQLWNRSLAGEAGENFYAVAVAPDDSIYAAGLSASYGAGVGDFWLVKFDTAGNQLWNRTVGGTNSEQATGVAVDASGVVLTGWTLSYGGTKALTVKFDASGEQLWNRTFTRGNIDEGRGIALVNGSAYMAGYTWSVGFTRQGATTVKYDTDGNVLWNRSIIGSGVMHGNAIALDGYGTIYLAGDTNSFGNGGQDLLNVRYDGIRLFNVTAVAGQIAVLNDSFTTAGDVWHACVTAFDGSESSATLCSDNVTILTTIPAISNVKNYSITNQSARINWSTTEQDNSTVSYGTTTALGSEVFNVSFAFGHDVGIAGLANNTVYYYNITSCDDRANCNTTGPFSFTTLQNTDNVQPWILEQQVQNITNQSAVINVTTNEFTNITVYYGTSPSVLTSFAYNNTFELTRLMNLTGLLNNTLYSYNITICDPFTNCNMTGPFSFTTLNNTQTEFGCVFNAGSRTGVFCYNSTANESLLTTVTINYSVLVNVTASNCIIINSTINVSECIDSNLTDSSFLFSRIDPSYAENCTSVGTEINDSICIDSRKYNSTLINSTAYRSFNNFTWAVYSVENASFVTNSTLYNSTLWGSMLVNVSVINATIANSTLHNSTVLNSTLVNITAYSCVLNNNGTLNDLVINCTAITQQAPVIDSISLNTTNPATNDTNQNLTLNIVASDADGDPITNITTWYRNGTSIMLLNMPFEGGSSRTYTKDYSGFGNTGLANASWLQTGGQYADGAYVFNGLTSFINITPNASLRMEYNKPFSIEASIKVNETAWQAIVGKATSSNNWRGVRFMTQAGGELTIDMISTWSTNVLRKTTTGAHINDSKWHHVMFTYDGSASQAGALFYVDGNLVSSSASYNTLSATIVSPVPLLIGAASAGTNDALSNQFNGSIGLVRIYNRTISAAEIKLLNASRTDVVHADETSMGDVWHACVTPNDGTQDGALSCSNNVTILAAAPVVTSISLNTTNPLTNDTDQNLTLNLAASDADGDPIRNITTWYRNGSSIMLLNMPFEGGSTSGTPSVNGTTKDYSSYGNTGSAVNAVFNATGGRDGRGAYILLDYRDFINLGDADALDIGTHDITVTMWVKYEGQQKESWETTRYAALYSDGVLTGADGYGLFLVNESIVLSLRNTSYALAATSVSGHNDGKWHFVAGTIARNAVNGLKLYVDGSLVGQENTTALGLQNLSNAQRTTIGVRDWNGAVAFDYNGSIDDVMVWNRSLSADQVRALFNNRTDLVVSGETAAGDVWHACVTPNDGTQDGTLVCSNNVTIKNDPVRISDVVSYNVTNQSARINWSTNVATNGTVSYGTAPGSLASAAFNVSFALGHDVNLSNLQNNTLYYYNITACDASGGCNTTGPFSFTTQNNTDAKPLSVVVQVQAVTNESAAINVTADESANVTIAYGTDLAVLSSYAFNGTFEIARIMNITGLLNATLYFFNVTSCGNANNCNTSGPFSFSTLQNTQPETPWDHCGEINASGYHVMTGPLNSSSDCFLINASDVTFDCAGFMVNYSQGATGHAIAAANRVNITVRNCDIHVGPSVNPYSHGINYTGLANSVIESSNVTLHYAQGVNAINVFRSGNVTIRNVSVVTQGGSGDRGVYVRDSNATLVANVSIRIGGIDATAGTAGLVLDHANDTQISQVSVNVTGEASDSFQSHAGAGTTTDRLQVTGSRSGYGIVVNGTTNMTMNNTVIVGDAGSPGDSYNFKLYINYAGVNTTHEQTVVGDVSALFGAPAWTTAALNVTGKNMRLGRNSIYLNSTNLSMYNVSAVITMANTGLISPVPYIYPEDNADGMPCPAEICTELSWADGTYVFQVAHFTNFTLQEGTNAPTIPILLSPAGNGNNDYNRTVRFHWANSTDADGDNLSYRIEVATDIGFLNGIVMNTTIQSGAGNETSFVNSTFVFDTDVPYFWRVTGFDGTVWGGQSNVSNFTVPSYLALTLAVNVVDFGNFTFENVMITNRTGTYPFTVRNDGNVDGNITIYSEPIFLGGPYPADSYRYEIESNETGSILGAGSTLFWANMTNLTHALDIVSLDWNETKDTANIHIWLTPPTSEPLGEKAAEITVSAE